MHMFKNCGISIQKLSRSYHIIKQAIYSGEYGELLQRENAEKFKEPID